GVGGRLGHVCSLVRILPIMTGALLGIHRPVGLTRLATLRAHATPTPRRWQQAPPYAASHRDLGEDISPRAIRRILAAGRSRQRTHQRNRVSMARSAGCEEIGACATSLMSVGGDATCVGVELEGVGWMVWSFVSGGPSRGEARS